MSHLYIFTFSFSFFVWFFGFTVAFEDDEGWVGLWRTGGSKGIVCCCDVVLASELLGEVASAGRTVEFECLGFGLLGSGLGLGGFLAGFAVPVCSEGSSEILKKAFVKQL